MENFRESLYIIHTYSDENHEIFKDSVISELAKIFTFQM